LIRTTLGHDTLAEGLLGQSALPRLLDALRTKKPAQAQNI
jgi:hypothetical protein